MWTKLTHLVKHRNADTDGEGNNDDEGGQRDRYAPTDLSNASAAANGSVMSGVYEQHPNLSVFHSGSAVNLASPSPPASPSKGSKRSMFKRSLKAKLTSTPVAQGANGGEGDVLSPASSVWTSPSPVKSMPKKLRASLQIDTFTAQSTNSEPTSGTAPETAPLPTQPHTPIFGEHNRNSESNGPFDPQPAGTGSIRSILRDPNTPGTGQSVRFFSRDAYRVISPNASQLELETDEDPAPGIDPNAFLDKLRSVSPENSASESSWNGTRFHSAPTSPPDNVVDMFSPPRPGMSAKSRKPLPFQPRHPTRTRNTSNSSSRSSHSRSDSGSISVSNSQSLSSLTMPVPPSDMPNLFDISHEHELADIPISVEGSLMDDAIEEVENENEAEEKTPITPGDMSMATIRRSSEHIPFASSTATPNRGQSVLLPRTILSPEGTVFHSIAGSSPAEGQTLSPRSFAGSANDRTSATMFFTPDASHAKTNNQIVFFTPDANSLTSPTSVDNKALVSLPDQAAAPTTNQLLVVPSSQELVIHSQEDLVTSLRGQLALQQQLVAQFEVDLSSRDELVSLLSTQLQNAQSGEDKYKKEVERRQSAMRALRRKVSELEKICRGLEDEVDRSREESFERSIMDEASGGALMVLQSSIGQLKGELERAKEDEAKVREERDSLQSEVEAFVDEKERREEVERDLRAALESRSEALEELENKLAAATQDQQKIDELQAELVQREQTIIQERERYHLADVAWTEEKTSMATRLEARSSDQNVREEELDSLRQTLSGKEEELKVLKAEVEAQWNHAERADERIKRVEGEKEALAKSVETLHNKMEELGREWKEGEVKRAELEEELNDAWAAKGDAEHERDQLVEDVNFEREHAEQLTQTLQEREAKLDEQEQEQGYTTGNVARLEELLRTRDAESTEAQARITEREQEAEQLRAQMGKMKREHSRLVDEQSRHLNEIIQREETARREMEDIVRQKAEDDVTLGSMKEQLGRLTDEVERLRRQVHNLQQESADKEVKLLQLMKARAQDKEDKEGLNIALDSKQQELELLKRKLGLMGTGGSTPAPNRVGLPDLASRRQSVAFATPSAPRPRPSTGASLAASTKTPTSEVPNKVGLSSNRSLLRENRSAAPPSTIKPTRSGSGSMGPPPAKRSSVSATPLSASTSSLSRSTSGKRSALPVSAHRRSSSIMSPTSPTPSEDKENAPIKVSRRTNMVPA